jgi:protein-tyrosine phosphatase
MGNICRSPLAAGVMRHVATEAGLADQLHIDSAGTGAWHDGEPPDERAVQAAARRGIAVDGIARQVQPADVERSDLVLCADAANVRDLLQLLPAELHQHRRKVRLLREFDAAALGLGQLDMPDPYYGEAWGFDAVLDHALPACRGLLEHVRHQLPGRI